MPKRKERNVPDFSLEGRPFIALFNLLKVEGWCEHGAAAKHVIDSGAVTVDGEVELRRRCKIVAGQLVRLGDEAVKVVA
jgi:ribosome-associated protein